MRLGVVPDGPGQAAITAPPETAYRTPAASAAAHRHEKALGRDPRPLIGVGRLLLELAKLPLALGSCHLATKCRS